MDCITSPDAQEASQPESSHSSAASHSSLPYEGSETSTLRYDQEPWTIFQERVEKLCQTLWPEKKGFVNSVRSSKFATWCQRNKWLPLRSLSRPSFIIQRLEGGDYNRITGVTLPAGRDKVERKLILRTPREVGGGRLDRQIALLEHLGRQSTIPVAKVTDYDFGSDNALASPYMIQERLEGRDLDDGRWNELTYPQRCSVAVTVGETVRQLLTMESEHTGVLEASKDDHKPTLITPFVLGGRGDEIVEQDQVSLWTADIRRPESTAEYFMKSLTCWRTYETSPSGELNAAGELVDDLMKMAQQMIDLGLFDSIGHCLCHVDLEPRNIMARVHPDQSAEVTGILDWDEAVFAPKFVNCKPPTWIWGEKEDVEDQLELWPYEATRADPSSFSPESRHMKHLFEQSAGPEFVRLANLPEYRLSRGLYSLAREGLCDNEGFKLADRMLREWELLRPTLQLSQ